MDKGMRNLKKVVLKLVLICFSISITAVVFAGCSKEPDPKRVFESYRTSWEKQDFKAMYALLSHDARSQISEEKFVERYRNIYSGIEAENVTVTVQYADKLGKGKEDKITIPFSVKMDTLAGNLELATYEAELVREKDGKIKQWAISWSEKMIFPELGQEDEVRASIEEPRRGSIFDRNGQTLATTGKLQTVQIEPKRFEADRVASIEAMSKILDISKESIEDKLNKNPNPDWAVPVVNLLDTDRKKISELMPLVGVVFRATEGRVYPGGEAFGALIGHIGPVTAEELQKPDMKGYSSTSMIGKGGLEQVYEKRLRGESGGQIYIRKMQEGKEVNRISLIKKAPKDGEDIKLAVDIDLQRRIYAEMKREQGSAAAVNPKTGEILALVSSPSYDSNVYSTYIPESLRSALDSSPRLKTNRFNDATSPGSTFKLVTAAIGLKLGVLNPEEQFEIKGKQWQPDGSWGGYKVTRVKETTEPINLLKAFMYSDNIYFARNALKIGNEAFLKESKNFGVGEELPIGFPFEKSQLVTGDKFRDDILLADTGFGQGEILISPLHIGMIYGSLANNGNMLKPILELKGEVKPEVWREKAIKPENVKLLTDALVQVVESPSGSGHAARIPGVRLAGKTGTAEVNSYKQGAGKGEDGWFVAFSPDKPSVLITMRIEDVKERGGSRFVVPIVKRVLEAELSR
jgi:penicillin-binding protein 3